MRRTTRNCASSSASRRRRPGGPSHSDAPAAFDPGLVDAIRLVASEDAEQPTVSGDPGQKADVTASRTLEPDDGAEISLFDRFAESVPRRCPDGDPGRLETSLGNDVRGKGAAPGGFIGIDGDAENFRTKGPDPRHDRGRMLGADDFADADQSAGIGEPGRLEWLGT